jgi:hypothetical protein
LAFAGGALPTRALIPHAPTQLTWWTMKHERVAYDALLQVKTPKSFANALDKAAGSHMMSRSDFIRATLLDRLKSDGIDVEQLAGAA